MKLKRPFFLVGSPRSGTTLLQVMLAASERFYIPPETHLLSYLRTLKKNISSKNLRDNICEIIRVHVCEHNELPVDWPKLKVQLLETSTEPADLLDTLLDHIHQWMAPGRRIGEKTPNHLLHVEYLLEHFKDAQVINVIRDGRDVVASHREAFGSYPMHSALRWRHHQREHFRLSGTLPADRYTSVRYEDLVTDPQNELCRLCEFLNEPFDTAMLQHHQRPERGFADRELHKRNTLKPTTTSRIGRYRNKLTRGEIAMIQTLAGKELQGLGYIIDPFSYVRGYLVAAAQLPFAWHHRHQALRNKRTLMQQTTKPNTS